MASRFEPVLRRAESALALPRRARAKILVELASDLEALYAAYRARGLPEEEAAARAARTLGVEAEAAGELSRLHEPAFRRWTSALPERGRDSLERALVTVLFLGLVSGGAAGLLHAGLLRGASPVVYPLLAAGVVMLLLSVNAWFRLVVVQRDADAGSSVRAVGAIALVSPLLGMAGALVHASVLAEELVEARTFSVALAAPALRQSMQVLALGLLVGVTSFLCWFHLRVRNEAALCAGAELDSHHAPAGVSK